MTNVEEHVMSKDKYVSILPLQIVVFIILQIFFATCTVLKIGKYHLYICIPQFYLYPSICPKGLVFLVMNLLLVISNVVVLKSSLMCV